MRNDVPHSRSSVTFLLIFLIASGVALSACDSTDSNEEQEPEDTTVQEDIANLNDALDALINDVSTWERGPTSRRMADAYTEEESVLGYQPLEEIVRYRWIDNIYYYILLNTGPARGSELSDLITRRRNDGQFVGLDFSASEGAYRWALERFGGEFNIGWEKTGSGSGIELSGPATGEDAFAFLINESPVVNDATVTLSSYTDQRVTFESGDVFLPTQASSTIDISNERVLELDLSNVEYDIDDDVSIPTSADLSLVTEPYEHTVQLRRNSDTEFDIQLSIQDEGDAVVDLGLLITLRSSDYTELAEEGSVENVNFQLDFPNGISLAGDVQLGRLESVSDPSEAQVNQFVSADVLYRGVEIATLQYEEAREDFIIEYKDGTTDPASDYYDDFMERLEGILVDLAGDDDWYDPRG